MRLSPHIRRTLFSPLRVILAAVFLVGILYNAGSAAGPTSRKTIAAVDFLEALRLAGPQHTVSFNNTLIEGQVHATSAGLDTVRASIRLRNTIFEEQVTLDRVVFAGPVRISKSTFKQGLSMLDSRFEQNVSFAKSSFGGHTTFKRTRFTRAARFVDIVGNGMMSFSSAVFEGDTADFTRARFLQPAYFDQVAFASGASFLDVSFELESSFKETRWSAGADFAGARFGEEALFRYAHFGGYATFDRSRFRREVSFDKARFERPASFRDITFVRTASFAHATFAQEADFAHCRFKREADFSDADFRAPFHLNAYFGRDLILRHATAPVLDLRPIPRDTTAEHADSTFSDTSRVFLHNADFGRMLFGWSQLRGRLASTDSTDFRSLDADYGAVQRHLKALGLADDARAAYRESMDRQRQRLALTSAERIWLEVFSATTRYGTGLGRLLWWALGVVLFFALVFRRLGASFSPPQPDRLWSWMYLSFCAFTRMSLPGQPDGRARLWVAAEAVLGWLFMACFIAICVRLLSS